MKNYSKKLIKYTQKVKTGESLLRKIHLIARQLALKHNLFTTTKLKEPSISMRSER